MKEFVDLLEETNRHKEPWLVAYYDFLADYTTRHLCGREYMQRVPCTYDMLTFYASRARSHINDGSNYWKHHATSSFVKHPIRKYRKRLLRHCAVDPVIDELLGLVGLSSVQ